MAFRDFSSAPAFGRRRLLAAFVALPVAATGAGRLLAHDATPTPSPTAAATPPSIAAGASDATPVASPQASPVASGPVVEVSMNALKYLPAEISIDAGTTVVWTNDDVVAHTVTQRVLPADQVLHSPMILPGESFAYTFDQPGIYPYFCEPHPFMTGRVTVS